MSALEVITVILIAAFLAFVYSEFRKELRENRAAFRSDFVYLTNTWAEGNKSLLEIMNLTNDGISEVLEEIDGIKSCIPSNDEIRIFLKGNDPMDGKNLVYTLARPALTANDIKTWTTEFYIADTLVGSATSGAAVEAIDFKVAKGTNDVKVAVYFTDTSGNPGDRKYSEPFDVIDNIPPAAPGDLTLTVREETDEDGDVMEVPITDEDDEDNASGNRSEE